ncbi:MAG TPA: hypothetical protein VKT82_15405 [Ktedonobacterales bacterium]|nr:hypothetical protein [Ktedonobacterales bacterium]
MHPASLLPAVIDGLRDLATALHLVFEQEYAEADALYAHADTCWHDGDHAGYARLMQEHARLLSCLDDLDALYWAANRTACDLAARLGERTP